MQYYILLYFLKFLRLRKDELIFRVLTRNIPGGISKENKAKQKTMTHDIDSIEYFI